MLLGAFLGTCYRCIKKEYTQKEFSMLLPGAFQIYASRSMQRVHSFLSRTRVKRMDRLITPGTPFWCHFIMKERMLECCHIRLGTNWHLILTHTHSGMTTDVAASWGRPLPTDPFHISTGAAPALVQLLNLLAIHYNLLPNIKIKH